MRRFYDFWRDEDGQDLIEYSLLITFFAIACLAMMASSKPAIQAVWSTGTSKLTSANAGLSGN